MQEGKEGMPELSKIVGLIMENPHLVEEISRLASGTKDGGTEESSSVTKEQNSEPAINTNTTNSGRRTALLTALKPFLSPSRASAIDSMVTFGEVFDVMRSGR